MVAAVESTRSAMAHTRPKWIWKHQVTPSRCEGIQAWLSKQSVDGLRETENLLVLHAQSIQNLPDAAWRSIHQHTETSLQRQPKENIYRTADTKVRPRRVHLQIFNHRINTRKST